MQQRLADGLKGAAWGAFIGGLAGLGVCTWLIENPPFFPGDTIAIGAAACGLLGFVFGERFLEWLRDNWWW